MGTEHTATTAAALFVERWSAALLEETTEEMVIVNNFGKPDGVQKIGKQLHIRKIKPIAATGGITSGLDLTYTANTEAEVTMDPVWAYAAVEINRAVYNRMDQNPDAHYRNMIRAGLATYIDTLGAALAASLATNPLGSGAAHADKGLLLDAEQALAISAKKMFRPGKTPWHLVFHPGEIKNLLNIFDFTADYIRADGEKAISSGWYSKVLNASLEESGNVYQSGGITHNLGHIKEAFVVAYNEEPFILDPQAVEMVVRIIGTTEVGVCEVFDEYAADIQTAA